METKSEGGNIGKYQRVKGGKTAEESRAYSVLGKIKKGNVDTLCRKLSLKYHLPLNQKGSLKKSGVKSVFSTCSCNALHMSGCQKPTEASL